MLNVVNNIKVNLPNKKELHGGKSEDSLNAAEEGKAVLKKIKNGKVTGKDLIPAI